ncbi:MAG: hypothetical protein PHV74_12480 [Dehalococcoidia bacterium]|nr:hypothetical protein [Dehalococcoidia bacterium]
MPPEILKPSNNNGHDRLAAQDLIHAMGSGDKAHTFVKPGKDTLELLMRTVFENERQARQVVLLYSKLVKYGFEDGLADLRALLAAKCSVKGRSRMEALMAEIQVLAPSLYTNTTMNDRQYKAWEKQQHQKQKAQYDDSK